jgi:hypothetical protein
MEQTDEPIRFLEGQRPEQHGIHDAEERGVRADAEGQHANHRQGKCGGAEQNPERVSKVGYERAHVGISLGN